MIVGRQPQLRSDSLSVYSALLACNLTADACLNLILGDFSCHVIVYDDGIVLCMVFK